MCSVIASTQYLTPCTIEAEQEQCFFFIKCSDIAFDHLNSIAGGTTKIYSLQLVQLVEVGLDTRHKLSLCPFHTQTMPPANGLELNGGMFARRAPGALLLDYVPPEEPPSTPLGNTLRIR